MLAAPSTDMTRGHPPSCRASQILTVY